MHAYRLSPRSVLGTVCLAGRPPLRHVTYANRLRPSLSPLGFGSGTVPLAQSRRTQMTRTPRRSVQRLSSLLWQTSRRSGERWPTFEASSAPSPYLGILSLLTTWRHSSVKVHVHVPYMYMYVHVHVHLHACAHSLHCIIFYVSGSAFCWVRWTLRSGIDMEGNPLNFHVQEDIELL